MSLVRKNRNPSGGLYRRRRRSAHDWRRTNAMRFLMKALMLRPAPRLMHAFRQNPLGLSGYTAFFESSAKPGLDHLAVIRAAYIGLMDLLARAQSYFSNLLLRSNPSSPQSALHRSRYFTHYIEQRQGQASSNHRVGLRSRLDLKSRPRKRRPTRLQVMTG